MAIVAPFRLTRSKYTTTARSTGSTLLAGLLRFYEFDERQRSRNGDVERVGETFVLRRLNRVPRSRQPTHACQVQDSSRHKWTLRAPARPCLFTVFVVHGSPVDNRDRSRGS